MASKKTIKARVPVFAAVVQPNYAWIEADSDNRKVDAKLPSGQTELPVLEAQDQSSPRYDDVAVITVPNRGTPESNAIRIHEMLHAKITPDVNAAKASVMDRYGVCELACQFAEDFRVAAVGYDLGLWGDDAHFGADLVTEMARRVIYSEDHQRTFGHDEAGLGTMTVPKAVELYCGFVGQPIHNGRVTDPEAFFADLVARGIEIDADVANAATYVCFGLLRDAETSLEAETPVDAFVRLAVHFDAVLREAFTPSLGDSAGERQQVSGEVIVGEAIGDGGSEAQQQEAKQDKPNKTKQQDKPEEPKFEKDPLASHKSRVGPSSHRAEIKYSPRSAIGKAKKALAEGSFAGGFDVIVDGESDGTSFEGEGYDRNKARSLILGSSSDVPSTLLNNYSLEPSDIGWPKTNIVLAPVERPRKSFVPRRGKPAMDGDIPRHFGRWIVDRAILDSRGRRPGGTLLIDISGSMSWSRQQINALLEELPTLTVALYSSSSPDGDEGQISIVARSGRIVSSDWKSSSSHSGGNLCDGVALSWLCKQPGPRIWLSDGAVTGPLPGGYGDTRNPAYVGDCLRLCALGAITLTRDDREVRAILEGRIKQRPVTPEEYHRFVADGSVVLMAERIAKRGVERMNDMLSGHDAA